MFPDVLALAEPGGEWRARLPRSHQVRSRRLVALEAERVEGDDQVTTFCARVLNRKVERVERVESVWLGLAVAARVCVRVSEAVVCRKF